MTRIAVIGGGRIGEALVAGLLESGRLTKDLVVVETHRERAHQIADRFGIRVTDDVADAAVGARPQGIEGKTRPGGPQREPPGRCR
ncbi:NAD(P)-binding domain-containing protein, partial [Nocardia gipuzkoensis]|uniref:NAD(P)-binding domain-containing protein n=1 Tax=Nocardia gipuzkoensis TaxID=2749991 RepID=UPI002457997A